MYGKIDKTKCFIALFCGSDEIVGNGYRRAEIDTGFYLNQNGVFINDTKIWFSKASSSWGRITHFALYNKSAEGIRIGSAGILKKPFIIECGQFASFAVGDLRIGIEKSEEKDAD